MPIGDLPRVALSVRQPWAWLIVNGFKDVENRGWPTKHRGPVFIHASKRPRFEADVAFGVLREVGMDAPRLAVHGREIGGIVGVATIVDCIRTSGSPWAVPGMWHWMLRDQMLVPFWACKGALGLFRCDYARGAV